MLTSCSKDNSTQQDAPVAFISPKTIVTTYPDGKSVKVVVTYAGNKIVNTQRTEASLISKTDYVYDGPIIVKTIHSTYSGGEYTKIGETNFTYRKTSTGNYREQDIYYHDYTASQADRISRVYDDSNIEFYKKLHSQPTETLVCRKYIQYKPPLAQDPYRWVNITLEDPTNDYKKEMEYDDKINPFRSILGICFLTTNIIGAGDDYITRNNITKIINSFGGSKSGYQKFVYTADGYPTKQTRYSNVIGELYTIEYTY